MKPIQKYFNDKLTTYYLIFTDTPTWRQYFLKDHFGHVYALTHDKYNWLYLNPRHLFMAVEILPCSISDEPWRKLAARTDSVVRIELYQRDNFVKFGAFGLRNCVTICKYLLGLRSRSLTPYGLYSHLLSMCPKERIMHGIHSVRKLQ